MAKRLDYLAEAIGQLSLDLGGRPTGCDPGGPVVAGEDREGREAEAGRAVPNIKSGQNARFLLFCRPKGEDNG